MPELTAPRFKRPLILFVAVLLIALPIGILAGQGRGGGQRGPAAGCCQCGQGVAAGENTFRGDHPATACQP